MTKQRLDDRVIAYLTKKREPRLRYPILMAAIFFAQGLFHLERGHAAFAFLATLFFGTAFAHAGWAAFKGFIGRARF